jgi:DNA-binding response OmpR family regulator
MAKIIAIDDDLEMRSLLEQVLRSAGHDVMTADEGRSGLAFCRTACVELLITDLVMRGMEGIETIRRFRNEFTGIPVIAISGNSSQGNLLEMAVRLGALRTLAKPFLPQELLEIVKAVLTASPRSASQNGVRDRLRPFARIDRPEE